MFSVCWYAVYWFKQFIVSFWLYIWFFSLWLWNVVNVIECVWLTLIYIDDLIVNLYWLNLFNIFWFTYVKIIFKIFHNIKKHVSVLLEFDSIVSSLFNIREYFETPARCICTSSAEDDRQRWCVWVFANIVRTKQQRLTDNLAGSYWSQLSKCVGKEGFAGVCSGSGMLGLLLSWDAVGVRWIEMVCQLFLDAFGSSSCVS